MPTRHAAGRSRAATAEPERRPRRVNRAARSVTIRRVRADAPPPAIEVAAGLIRDDAGRYLITQRPSGTHLAGLWEFPGGKRHAGESLEQCLARELREELGAAFAVGERVETVTWDYPEKRVVLHFYRCRHTGGTIVAHVAAALAWVAPERLHAYEFPPPDRTLVARLQAPRACRFWTAAADPCDSSNRMTTVAPPALVNLRDYEAAARDRLPPAVYDFYAGGAGDEITVRDNEAAWGRLRLRPRVLVDVATRIPRASSRSRARPPPSAWSRS
jgi:8-oxo-dGTP diphosphatase